MVGYWGAGGAQNLGGGMATLAAAARERRLAELCTSIEEVTATVVALVEGSAQVRLFLRSRGG